MRQRRATGPGLRAELAAVVDDALEGLVLPGVAHVGVDVTAGARWLAEVR